MPTATQPTNTTLSTTDYSLFSFIDANRKVVNTHVNKLKDSIEESGNFTEVVPILVNGRMEIIDGQHRFTALKELGLPVHYTIVEGTNAHTARTMNAFQRNWMPMDYLESYASEGIQSYVKLKQLTEDYPEVYLYALMTYAINVQNRGLQAKFRRGEMPDFDLEDARKRINPLVELIELNPVFSRKVVALAFLRMVNSPDYDHSRMVRKVRQLNPEILPYQGINNNLRQLEEVYNHMLTTDNRVRFF